MIAVGGREGVFGVKVMRKYFMATVWTAAVFKLPKVGFTVGGISSGLALQAVSAMVKIQKTVIVVLPIRADDIVT